MALSEMPPGQCLGRAVIVSVGHEHPTRRETYRLPTLNAIFPGSKGGSSFPLGMNLSGMNLSGSGYILGSRKIELLESQQRLEDTAVKQTTNQILAKTTLLAGMKYPLISSSTSTV